MKAKEQVFDRIEQSFSIFKDNFLWLFLPLFLYTTFTAVIFQNVSKYYWINFIQKIISNYDKDNLAGLLHYDSQAIIWLYVFVILFVLYLTLYIPFLIATIKWIKQAYNWEKINCKENIVYWFKNLFESFQTYWFSFAYVALIPSIIWIIWWILFIYWNYSWNSSIESSWWAISIFALVLFIFFAIYRWIKASFYMSSAIDKNEFTKDNFNFSVKVTNNNWWRIFWNFLLIWIIISMISSILYQIIWLNWSSFDYSSLMNIWKNAKPEEIMNTANQTLNSYSPTVNLITSILENIVNTIWNVFILIFTYILFKRLEIENGAEITEKESISKEKIEL